MTTEPFNPNDYSFKQLSKIYRERRGNIVFWFGAGASATAKLPTWNALKEILAQHCFEHIQSLPSDEGEAEFQRVELAQNEPNGWLAFEVFQDILGKHKFIDILSEVLVDAALKNKDGNTKVYDKCWKMNAKGAISLNIDPLCEYSHGITRTGEVISSSHGRNAADLFRYVNAMKPFIFYAHGKYDSPSSWVFTKSDVDSLLSDDDYRTLVNFIFQNFTVVFVGITATDVAAGGLLSRFADNGIILNTHYWITDRNDVESRSLAKRLGISQLLYNTENLSHEDAICGLLDFIRLYNSKEPPPKAIKGPYPPETPASDVNDFLISGLSDRDGMRMKLSAFMNHVLGEVDFDSENPKYETFRRDFKDALRLSWEAEVGEDYLGYHIVSKCGGRNTSDVYKARSKSGEDVAIKVLKLEKWRNPLYASSFRRGVEAMSILTEKKLAGAADIIEAHEAPQAVVMRYCEGLKLADVVNYGSDVFSFWVDGISIAIKIGEYLVDAHHLDEGVLHRDLRPSNIVLERFYYDDEDGKHDVRILNYDLSWHKSATGGVGIVETEVSAFHAPEQIEDINGSEARSTLVDSYGLGMLVYYMYTGNFPPILGGKQADWPTIVQMAFRESDRNFWKSASIRLGRMVLMATKVNQNDRVNVKDIIAELVFLRSANALREPVQRADCWAEELMCRAGYTNYEWDESSFSAKKVIPPNRVVVIRGDITKQLILIEFQNVAGESTDRATISKMWKKKCDQAIEIFKSGGWKVNADSGLRFGEILFRAQIEISSLANKPEQTIKTMKSGLNCISLD